ncbi:MAG: sugar ABC transporter substrate-binding protein, multiple sugar transport system substrate-binding protein [candidate division WS6 bacterium GW2011_GWC1_33_20]|uniref:Extracellular solute-binding protein family 1 n=2 Tax=Candidatus Dojkabacteria TaxID=74243 RepID=A0A0G0AUX5_9BACT|nr:MAG: sugar ABC transporter substrate-binding protein, multiple sugar transport system substrate-binding protein [candidate division WS6 bacterium GW2011_GWE2_33_157]KKP43653.1 MAG: sugar ABC transporter substrate-binding protein, multiple sugar transport system substrate-binding protein [candidate division WS6 bacterium GW2011_GWC1_33_20]KKP45386.1 MAG: sugar ABC transporter substrate-binding protein, multiple sugar transport system substrate-binding protein [candidate division WS6 bacterium G
MNSKQKKQVIFLSILAVILLAINGVLAVMAFKPESTPQDIEIVYWGIWEPDAVMHPLIEKYEAENPGVKILYSKQSIKNFESLTYARLEQATKSSEPAPDIIRISNTWLPKFQKYLYPIPEDIFSKEEFKQEFYPTVIEDFTGTDGEIYAIPLQIDGLMVIYNKQLLAREGYSTPPQDWDSFMYAAQKLTKRDDKDKITQSGLAIGTSRNITNAASILMYFFLQNDADLMNDANNQVNLTSERAVSALDTYTSFTKETNATWAPYLANDLTTFMNGDLAMIFGTTWTAFEILESAPEIEFGLAPLPQLPNNEKVYYASYWGDTVSKTSKNRNEAWKFIKFLSEPEQQRRLFANSSKIRAFGEPYSRVSMNAELAENTYTKAIAQMAPYMKSWQIGEQTFVENLLTTAITEVAENNKESRNILESIETQINEKLAVSNK